MTVSTTCFDPGIWEYQLGMIRLTDISVGPHFSLSKFMSFIQFNGFSFFFLLVCFCYPLQYCKIKSKQSAFLKAED